MTDGTLPIRSPLPASDAAASMLGLPALQAKEMDAVAIQDFGVFAAFRLQRILVGKTPNLTSALALA